MSITLTVAQLMDAASLNADDPETEITIEKIGAWNDKECGEQPAGYYAYLTEYPEEGLYGPLGETTHGKRLRRSND